MAITGRMCDTGHKLTKAEKAEKAQKEQEAAMKKIKVAKAAKDELGKEVKDPDGKQDDMDKTPTMDTDDTMPQLISSDEEDKPKGGAKKKFGTKPPGQQKPRK